MEIADVVGTLWIHGPCSKPLVNGDVNAHARKPDPHRQALQVVKRRMEDIDSQLMTETNEAKQAGRLSLDLAGVLCCER